ncbi:response regulator transcription factor [Desulfitibacter alkalitolerans]|uniref:response regulator transcription factor n=1 Tax=Desulfitibacter alkalitolerans TaxID=264641 RepID=UPI0004896FB4|nr:response regulator [Desulfitibacter alkalitolerans]
MKKITVFIVEDDPMVVSINKRFTEKIVPFKVIGTSSSQDNALTQIKQLRPDIVLLDIFLPQGNGLEILKQIRQQDIPTDVILITAAKDTYTIYQTMRYGAIDYIIKPFDMERLEQSLRNYEKLRLLLNKKTDLNQSDIDRITTPGEDSSQKAQPSLPKGLHLITLEQIISFMLKQNKPLSCQQIATSLNMSKITAWRYLDYLTNVGKVLVALEYGIGRPTKLYMVKSNDTNNFDK